MEKNKKTPILLILIVIPYTGMLAVQTCPSLPNKNLTCYNDFNRIITCQWNSTHNYADSHCTIYAQSKNSFSNSCKLESDFSRPMVKKCSVVFQRKWRFQTFSELNIVLHCDSMKQSLNISYHPVCHIKLDPPPIPYINSTNIFWYPQVSKHERLQSYKSELQWKQKDQPWEPPLSKECIWVCQAQLPDDLIKNERYEARIRVKPSKYSSIWSDWSPTVSWVTTAGKAKPPPDVAASVLGTLAGIVGLALLIIIIKSDKTTWIYIVKRLSGPPLPNPGKSFLQDVNFQNLLNPHFTAEYFKSPLKPVEIVSVEVTSTLDGVAPNMPEAMPLEKMSSKSSYESNLIYSKLSSPGFSLTSGNIETCNSDTPYEPSGCEGDSENAVQIRDEVTEEEVLIQELLSKATDTKPMQVNLDYEKVERPQVERIRLHSLDSGLCSGEEVSQESLEADSINTTDSHDEWPEGKEVTCGRNGENINFQKLFEDSGISDKESINVHLGYEQVQKLQADSLGLLSLDSGISTRGEEQVSQQVNLEDVAMPTAYACFPFSQFLSSSALEFPLPFTSLPLNFSGNGLSPVLQPLSSHVLNTIALMSKDKSDECFSDGYMAVSQENS